MICAMTARSVPNSGTATRMPSNGQLEDYKLLRKPFGIDELLDALAEAAEGS